MRHDSTIITTLALAALIALPSAAAAGSPLLSGYGGPGAGAQQIIGAGLVGGGGGRGGGPGASAGGGAGASNGGAGSSSGSRASGSGGASSGKSAAGRRHGRGSSSAGASGRRSIGTRAIVPASTLGLSDSQLLMVLIVAAGLILIAMSTRWLAGMKREGGSADERPMSLRGGH